MLKLFVATSDVRGVDLASLQVVMISRNVVTVVTG